MTPEERKSLNQFLDPHGLYIGVSYNDFNHEIIERDEEGNWWATGNIIASQEILECKDHESLITLIKLKECFDHD